MESGLCSSLIHLSINNFTYVPASGSMTGLRKYLAASSLSLVTSWTRSGPAEGQTGCRLVCMCWVQPMLWPGPFTGTGMENRTEESKYWAADYCGWVLIVFQGSSDSCVGISGSDCSSKGLDIGHLTWERDAEDTHLGSLGNLYPYLTLTMPRPQLFFFSLKHN